MHYSGELDCSQSRPAEQRFNIGESHRQLRDALDGLNKYTHVGEATFDLPSREVDFKVSETLRAILEFLELIDQIRDEIASGLEEEIDAASINAAISETIGSIDELATHHSVDEVEVERVEVVGIDDSFVHFKATGTVYVELQWGSNSDVKKDMGALAAMDFPFECILTAPVDDLKSVSADEGAFLVDTSKWRVHDE